MKQLLYLILKDIRLFVNDKPAMALTFIVPIVLIIIFGNIFSGEGSRGKPPVIFINESSSPVARMFESKLDTSGMIRLVKSYTDPETNAEIPIDENKAKELVKTGKYSAALVLPTDFYTDTSTAVKFKYYFDPRDEIESNLIRGAIQQTVMTEAPKLIPILLRRKFTSQLGAEGDMFNDEMTSIVSRYFDIDKEEINKFMNSTDSSLVDDSAGNSGEANFMSNIIKFESEQLVGKELKNPNLTRIVGGWAMMFLLFSLTGAATSLFEEKNYGVLKRMICMPLNRNKILISKYVYAMMIGIVQLIVVFISSNLLFDVEVFNNIINLLIVVIASSAAAVSFGMIITASASTFNQANGMATFLIITMSALGGSWFPITLLPDWMQTIAHFTITYWSVEAFQQVLWRQAEFGAIALHVGILLAVALIVNTYAIILFKRKRSFQ